MQRAIEFVLQHEGGYVNDPADPGGETKYGISKRAFPALDIKDLSQEQAATIYRQRYWQENRLDELAPPVALVVFDAAVNCGSSRAVKWLQEAVNLALQPPSNGKLIVDGRLGPNTINAAGRCQPLRLALAVNASRLQHYADLAEGASGKYLRGWCLRLAGLQKLLCEVS